MHHNYVTGSGKTDQLAQAIIFAIYIPDDRAKNCLRIDMLSVHIPHSMPELCALETRSCKTAVYLKHPVKDCGKV